MKLKWPAKIIQTFTSSKHRDQFINSITDLTKMTPSKLISLFLFTNVCLSFYYISRNHSPYTIKFSFTRTLSRIAGMFGKLTIPNNLRPFVYGTYSSFYNVKVEDMQLDFKSYKNFSQFFTRQVKERQIDINNRILCSPCDSKILTIGYVDRDEQYLVKGKQYSLGELLTGIEGYVLENEVIESMKKKKNTDLIQCVFYLAPGDYHRYHSPLDMIIKKRLHIDGVLKPVKISYLESHNVLILSKKVYEKNERVCLFGEGNNGFVSLVMVGAMNVGSIVLHFDDQLKTNQNKQLKDINTLKIYNYGFSEKEDETDLIEFDEDTKNIDFIMKDNNFKNTREGVSVQKGQDMGFFNFGSTIVMLVEVSKEAKILIRPGDTVRYGQTIFENI